MQKLIITFVVAGMIGGLAAGLAKGNAVVLGVFLIVIFLIGFRNHKGGIQHIEESKTLGWDKNTIATVKKRAHEWQNTGIFFGILFGIVFTYFMQALEIWNPW